MKRLSLIVVCTLLLSLLVSDAHARRRLFRRARGCSSHSGSVQLSGTDQQKAQQKANYMAKYRIRGHVWAPLGAFEGVGFGGYGCATCVPARGRLTADAGAWGSDGVYYRVRVWR